MTPTDNPCPHSWVYPRAESDTSRWDLRLGDCLDVMRTLPECSVQTCVTSPPYYGLRDYGHEGQIGLEPTPAEYVERLVAVFREVRRVLRPDGTLWVNIGDSYAGSWGAQGRPTAEAHPIDCDLDEDCSGHGAGLSSRQIQAHPRKASRTGAIAEPGVKAKDLYGIPWRVAFALQADGWYLRQDIIWHKPNPMPESVRDRCTKAHEYVFLLTKEPRYFYDAESVREEPKAWNAGRMNAPNMGAHRLASPYAQTTSKQYQEVKGANRRSVWSIGSQPFDGAHFAVMPEALVEPCILAGSRRGDTVLDPFTGSGTVGAVAVRFGRRFVGAELNPVYRDLARKRIAAAEGTAPTTTTNPDGTRITQHTLFATNP